DNVKARILRADGTHERATPAPGAPLVRSQERFMALARRASSAAEAAVPAADVFPNQRRPERRRKRRTLASARRLRPRLRRPSLRRPRPRPGTTTPPQGRTPPSPTEER